MSGLDAPEVLCLGETMALLSPVTAESLEDAETCRLDVGGAESTVALYLSEAGRHTAWVSRVGDDPLGRRVRSEIARHGVDVRWVTTTAAGPTGVYFKDPHPDGTTVHYYRDGSAASTMGPEDADRLPLDGVRVVHLSGITPALSDSCRALVQTLVERVAASPALLSFDVNHRPGLWSAEQAAPLLLELARRSDVVLVGRDEAERLWGTGTAADVREHVGAGPRLVVKDGAVGAWEFDPDSGPTFVPAPRVEVVEPVGAGDAFAAGWLDALLDGTDASARLTRGHAFAGRALVSTRDFAPLTGG